MEPVDHFRFEQSPSRDVLCALRPYTFLRVRTWAVVRLLLASCLSYAITVATANADATLEYDERIGMEGLYFWYSDSDVPAALFNREVSPKGDAFVIIDGYAFLVWYKGGMDTRNLMLSRMKIGSNAWKTIQFPERNTLYTDIHRGIDYRNNPGGDSHRTAAIGISTIDGTIHITHDSHVTPLRYRVSEKNIAFAPDSAFTLSNFEDERDYFRSGEPLSRFTYPNFNTNADGELVMDFRIGTARQGDRIVAFYDGEEWSPLQTLIKGDNASPEFNLYGGLDFHQGELYLAGTARIKDDPIGLNQGLFFARTDQRGLGPWRTAGGSDVTLPIRDVDVLNRFRLADPVNGPEDRMGSAPSFLAARDGSLHMSAFVSGKGARHYFVPKGASEMRLGGSGPGGLLFSLGDRIYGISSNTRGAVTLSSSPQDGSDWQDEYVYRGTPIQAAVFQYYQGKLYIIGAEKVESDSRPFRQIVIDLGLPVDDVPDDGDIDDPAPGDPALGESNVVFESPER